MSHDLLRKIADSDMDGVRDLIKMGVAGGRRAWDVHLSLFPVALRVMNPPYINPHLPKMHGVCREFLPYLEPEDLPALVELEILEYTARPKLKEVRRPARPAPPGPFSAIEAAIKEGEPQKVAVLMAAFMKERGGPELARNMLLLGSGYIGDHLGHSVSCTTFFLLEMMERSDQDPWPALVLLADYFCKGFFHTSPVLRGPAGLPPQESLDEHLMRATSGTGIRNLHHTITRWAIERARHHVSNAEYAHMIAGWVGFVGDKAVEPPAPVSAAKVAGYDAFFGSLSNRDEAQALSAAAGMLSSKEGRRRMGRYLIKGVCELHRPNYDPHYLTGLAAALWVAESHADRVPIAMNALRQYVNYFLTSRPK